MKYPKPLIIGATLLTLLGCGGSSGGGSSSGGGGSSENENPTAEIKVDPSFGSKPLTVRADISGSSDSNGYVAKYKLDCDSIDGLAFEKQGTNLEDVITCTYDTAGNRQITLEVTDNDGATDRATANVNVDVGVPIISNPVSPSVTYSETSTQLTYSANATDPNGTIAEAYFTVNGIKKIPSVSGSVYTLKYTPTDGGKLNVILSVKDNEGNVSTHTFSELPIYLSETDGQNAILDSVPIDLKTYPSDEEIDQSHTFVSTFDNIDVMFKFVGPTGTKYTTYDCNNARIPVEYNSINNELDESELVALASELANSYPYCGVASLRMPFTRIDYTQTNGDPTTKANIGDIVNTLLTGEDVKINYNPIADAGYDRSILKNQDTILDGSNSSDDGFYNCEWDINGDGIYDAQVCTLTTSYIFDSCVNATLKVIDDEGAQNSDTVKIEVGTGKCD